MCRRKVLIDFNPFGVMVLDLVPQLIDVGNRPLERGVRRCEVVLELGLRLDEVPGLAVGGLERRLELAVRIDGREEVALGGIGAFLGGLELALEQRGLGVGPGHGGREAGVFFDLFLEGFLGFVDGASRFLADAPALVAGPARFLVRGGGQAGDELVDVLIGFRRRLDGPRRGVNRSRMAWSCWRVAPVWSARRRPTSAEVSFAAKSWNSMVRRPCLCNVDAELNSPKPSEIQEL